eukprot:TRINITY_DN28811_c0_g1_i2.p1 TRINITY_DN28811_c0_g1~~TRINITY_DN28811_c0_g1_i2.p1  ORF type:complete len:568 (+),score=58.55 TRINITY_DN28811_c0_g1_i2:36-1706(+)
MGAVITSLNCSGDQEKRPSNVDWHELMKAWGHSSESERPRGIAGQGSSAIAVYTPEQQQRLGVTELGDALHVSFNEGAPVLSKTAPPEVGMVTVVRTSQGDIDERLKVIDSLKLEPGRPAREAPNVVLDASVRYQTVLGFGGSFTESSANLMQKLGPQNQEKLINAYFNADTGLGYQVGRVHMNSCDFSTGNWSCVDDTPDETLDSFTIDHYKESILPMIKRAMAATAEGALQIIFSPWSPPAWMKDNGKMNGGTLQPKYFRTWARYYVRFAEEFKSQGVSLWGVTVQNEPAAGTPWETCYYSAEDERDFVRDHLGPALEASGLGLKLLVWDHNRNEMFERASTIYGDPEAAKYVWGVSYHWYGDPRYEWWPDEGGMTGFDNLQLVHDLRPDKHIVMTECCQEMGPRMTGWQLGERYAESIIKDFNHWCEAWIDWNLLLDERGGPNWRNNCCSAPIISWMGADRLLFLSSYYYIGHFSRYIRPGAQRIAAASSRDALEVTAFINPDETLVAVVLNQSNRDYPFSLQYAGNIAQARAPPRSISTFILQSNQALQSNL